MRCGSRDKTHEAADAQYSPGKYDLSPVATRRLSPQEIWKQDRLTRFDLLHMQRLPLVPISVPGTSDVGRTATGDALGAC
jgi:hypothetical protein